MPEDAVQIVVITLEEDLEESFGRHEPMRAVLERALALVGGDSQRDRFRLEYGEHALIGLDRPVAEFQRQLGWGDEVELELVPTPVGIPPATS
jgi:hypothetical protein